MRAIDVRHLGREHVICCWQVGDVLVDPGPESCLATLLEELGGERPRALLLTHIHLDHAGASGALVERWPDLKVHVHRRGAAHLAEPSRLIESAGRLYGDEMQRLWGRVVPVPERNLVVLDGGEQVEGFRVAYTPGHASHHVCYLHEESGRAFVGDMAGALIPPSDLTFPPTPPPDIDLEAWRESLRTISSWAPSSLGLTHFGQVDDPQAQLAAIEQALGEWGALAREAEAGAGFVAAVRERFAQAGSEELAAAYEQAAPPEQQWLGLERYWRKRREAQDG